MGEAAQSNVGRSNTALVLIVAIGALALLGLAAIALDLMLHRATSGDGPPQCDATPVGLEWSAEGRRRRSTPFELTGSTQIVQVDVQLMDSGNGVVPDWKTVTAVRAGIEIAATSTDGSPSADVQVGIGVEAVNERVTLGAGDWELLVNGEAGVATIRWPC
jgi:hypothetical protein